MTSQGSAYARFQRALKTGNLTLIRNAAGELPHVELADALAVYLDLIVWQAQATAAAEYLAKGQAVSFSGRLEPRPYMTSSGDQRVALVLHGVDIDYGAKPRTAEPSSREVAFPEAAEQPDDIPF